MKAKSHDYDIPDIQDLADFVPIPKIKYPYEQVNTGQQNNINNLFFKIDIEGSEYRILDELIKIKDKITGIIIEFHDVDLHVTKIENFINNIGLKLIHIHPNNFGGLDRFGNPNLIELTFEKKPILLNETNILPHKHDMKNNPHSDDINLIFNTN